MTKIYLWKGKPLLVDGKLAISEECCCDECELECCCDCFFPAGTIPYPEGVTSGQGVPPPCDGFLNCDGPSDPRNFYCVADTEIVNYFSNWWYSEAGASNPPTNIEYQLINVIYQTGKTCSLVSICADDTNQQWVLQHLCEFIVPICSETYERGFCYEEKPCDPEVDPESCCENGALLNRISSAFTTVYDLNVIRDGNEPVDEYAGNACSFTSQIGQVGWFGFYYFQFPGCAGCRTEWKDFITGSTPTFANLKIEQGACLVGASPCAYPIAEGADGDWDEDGYIDPVEDAPEQEETDCYEIDTPS